MGYSFSEKSQLNRKGYTAGDKIPDGQKKGSGRILADNRSGTIQRQKMQGLIGKDPGVMGPTLVQAPVGNTIQRKRGLKVGQTVYITEFQAQYGIIPSGPITSVSSDGSKYKVNIGRGFGEMEFNEASVTNEHPIKSNWHELVALANLQGAYSINPNQPTDFLQTLKPATDTHNWAGGHKELAAAHHKLGKNVMAWLYEHMEPDHQMALKKALHMDWDSGAMAMTRLGSNLISPITRNDGMALSGSRTDDPMNNQAASAPGERYLDMMHDTQGDLTPRSHNYSDLAHGLIRDVHRRHTEWTTAGHNSSHFRMKDEDVGHIIKHLRHAEMINTREENAVGLPSHSSASDAFVKPHGRFTKRQVNPIDPGVSLADEQGFELLSGAELQKKLARKKEEREKRKQAKLSFREWFNLQDVDVSEDIDDMHDLYGEYLNTEENDEQVVSAASSSSSSGHASAAAAAASSGSGKEQKKREESGSDAEE